MLNIEEVKKKLQKLVTSSWSLIRQILYVFGTEVFARKMCENVNFYNFQMVIEDMKFLS